MGSLPFGLPPSAQPKSRALVTAAGMGTLVPRQHRAMEAARAPGIPWLRAGWALKKPHGQKPKRGNGRRQRCLGSLHGLLLAPQPLGGRRLVWTLALPQSLPGHDRKPGPTSQADHFRSRAQGSLPPVHWAGRRPGAPTANCPDPTMPDFAKAGRGQDFKTLFRGVVKVPSGKAGTQHPMHTQTHVYTCPG